MDVNNGWTEAKIKSLAQRLALSKVYRLCHTSAYEYYKRIFNRSTMCITVLGAVTTILEGTNLLIEKPDMGIGIAVLICAALSGILGSYIRTKDPSQMAAGHQDMSKGYNRIILDIESEMALDPSERKSGSEYIKWLSNTLQDMSTGGQILPTFIFNNTQRQINSGELDPAKFWGNETFSLAASAHNQPNQTNGASPSSRPHSPSRHSPSPAGPPAPPSSPASDNDSAVVDIDAVPLPTYEVRANDVPNPALGQFQLERLNRNRNTIQHPSNEIYRFG